MGTNLVVIKAKKFGLMSKAAMQVIAYMAIIHATRREEGKQNCTIYGICSDGNSF